LSKLSRAERIEIARTRLLRVIGNHTVATMRTLEMKISDAGPFNQRIDPHILTDARDAMVEEGVLQRWQAAEQRTTRRKGSLRGDMRLDWREGGVVCEIAVPI
jgi:hypothetical protein